MDTNNLKQSAAEHSLQWAANFARQQAKEQANNPTLCISCLTNPKDVGRSHCTECQQRYND